MRDHQIALAMTLLGCALMLTGAMMRGDFNMAIPILGAAFWGLRAYDAERRCYAHVIRQFLNTCDRYEARQP